MNDVKPGDMVAYTYYEFAGWAALNFGASVFAERTGYGEVLTVERGMVLVKTGLGVERWFGPGQWRKEEEQNAT